MKADFDFRFPAEWETHRATWLCWPHNRETWPNNLAAAQEEFARFALALAEVEDVFVLASEELPLLKGASRITPVDLPTNDSWIRDYGPTFVKSSRNSSTLGINWIYDGWGKKYPPFDLDQQAASSILNYLEMEKVDSELILEGGSIESNGDSICLTTLRCQTRRNPGLSVAEIETELRHKLGLPQIVMLNSVEIDGDDTDSHVDQVARFVARDRVVISRRQVGAACPTLGELGLDWIELPDPDPVMLFGVVLPASYTNFYIANGLVVVPQFDDPADAIALSILGEQFADRDVIGLPSRQLAVGLGSFHCLSQQQPA